MKKKNIKMKFIKTFEKFSELFESNDNEIEFNRLNSTIKRIEDSWRMCLSKAFDYNGSFFFEELRKLPLELSNIEKIINNLLKNIPVGSPSPIRSISLKINQSLSDIKQFLRMIEEAMSLRRSAFSLNNRGAIMRIQELNQRISQKYPITINIIKTEIENLKKEIKSQNI